MNNMQFKEAREMLGLSVIEMAEMLDTDEHTISQIESDPGVIQHQALAPRIVRLMNAYIDGHRPDDWPGELLDDWPEVDTPRDDWPAMDT
ncbi:hypothetical protein [Thioclava sp. GXIMD2076]|uniref:hypothetical protein n=1 Tax=Thioclava sp. GXIMD2076 TaxID=3131931 RepID=UPI0030D3F7ED